MGCCEDGEDDYADDSGGERRGVSVELEVECGAWSFGGCIRHFLRVGMRLYRDGGLVFLVSVAPRRCLYTPVLWSLSRHAVSKARSPGYVGGIRKKAQGS